jgi:hypothetical protein
MFRISFWLEYANYKIYAYICVGKVVDVRFCDIKCL